MPESADYVSSAFRHQGPIASTSFSNMPIRSLRYGATLRPISVNARKFYFSFRPLG